MTREDRATLAEALSWLATDIPRTSKKLRLDLAIPTTDKPKSEQIEEWWSGTAGSGRETNGRAGDLEFALRSASPRLLAKMACGALTGFGWWKDADGGTIHGHIPTDKLDGPMLADVRSDAITPDYEAWGEANIDGLPTYRDVTFDWIELVTVFGDGGKQVEITSEQIATCRAPGLYEERMLAFGERRPTYDEDCAWCKSMGWPRKIVEQLRQNWLDNQPPERQTTLRKGGAPKKRQTTLRKGGTPKKSSPP